ncbi:glycosyltransferase [Glycocaulis abyssi]|uniref:glycosyltransferase n=1 Tax=Glycocaulis abyssi TaxID=1433403 RepID=UPI00352BA594
MLPEHADDLLLRITALAHGPSSFRWTLPFNGRNSRGWVRHIEHSLVISTISKYDAFFLPSRGENFGHAIAKSLSAGTPVLISDQTPWNDVGEHNAGWALSLDHPSEFVAVIESMSQDSNEIRHERNVSATKYYLYKSNQIPAVDQNRRMLKQP